MKLTFRNVRIVINALSKRSIFAYVSLEQNTWKSALSSLSGRSRTSFVILFTLWIGNDLFTSPRKRGTQNEHREEKTYQNQRDDTYHVIWYFFHFSSFRARPRQRQNPIRNSLPLKQEIKLNRRSLAMLKLERGENKESYFYVSFSRLLPPEMESSNPIINK